MSNKFPEYKKFDLSEINKEINVLLEGEKDLRKVGGNP